METVKTKFSELIQNSEKPVLVDFYANWCSPCHAMAPVLKEVAAEFSNKIKIIKVDIDKNPAVSTQYKIISIPTLILFHKGEIKWRESGVIPGYALKKVMAQF
jgi:thioredoxin 1